MALPFPLPDLHVGGRPRIPNALQPRADDKSRGIEITSGFDSQMINAVQIVDAWDAYFNSPEGALKGIIAAIYSLGAICSLPFVPLVNDRLGRRWSIFIGSAIMIVGAAIQAAAQNVGMYLLARWLLGFGIPACIVAGSALLGELGYPKERPILGGLFNSSYFVGAIVAAGITYGTTAIPNNWSWRVPSLLQAAPSLLQCSLVFMIPESPRWLIARDRREEALAILVKYHAEGDASSALVQAEMAQIETTVKLEIENSKKSWADVFRTSGMRRRLLVGCLLGLFTQWSGNTLISYYLTDILEMIGYTGEDFKGKLNVSLTCWQLVNATILALIIPRFKRRPMYLICVCLLLVVYISWTIAQERFLTTGSLAAGQYVIFVMFAYSPCYNIAYNALTYSEPFPRHRSRKHPLMYCSLPRRALSLRGPLSRNHHLPALRPRRRLLQHLRQPHRPRQRQVEIPHQLLRLARLRDRVHLLPVARDWWPYARGAHFLYVLPRDGHDEPNLNADLWP